MSKQEVTWRQWAMVCALTVLFIYAQIDSGSITLLVGPIKQDIGATDTQMGLLPGLSFAAPFAILGVLAGYLVDRMSRRRIIGIGVVLWSLMTFSCGLAQNYWQFFFTRLGAAAPRPPRRAGAGGGSRLSGHAAAFEIGRADVFVCE